MFICLECLPYSGVFDDVTVIPEDELVPSLQGLAALALVQGGRGLQGLPPKVGLCWLWLPSLAGAVCEGVHRTA